MAFEESEVDVNIKIKAEDEASRVVQDATKKINREWTEMRNQQRAVERQFELNNRTFVRSLRVLSTIGSTINGIRSIYNTFLLQQIRQGQIAQRNTDLQIALNDAITEYGLNSRQASDAQKALTEGLKDAEPNLEKIIGDVLIYGSALSVVIRSLRVIPSLMKNIKPLATSGTAKPTGSGSTGSTSGTAKGGGLKSKVGKIGGGLAGIGAGLGIISAIDAFANLPLAGGGEEDADITALREARANDPIGQARAQAGEIIVNVIGTTAEDIIQGIQNGIKQLQGFGGES